jgi:hypothetical protein
VTPEPTPDAHETDSESSAAAVTDAVAAFDVPGLTPAVLGAGVVGCVAVDRLVSVLANVPFDPVVAPPTVRTAAGLFALVAVVSALIGIAVVDGRATVRVGLLFAAVFGTLPFVAPETTLLAVVAVAGGGALALVGASGVSPPTEWTYRTVRQRLVALGFVTALALTLAGATGVLDGGRNPGAFVTLAGITAVGIQSEGSRLAWLAGLLAAAAVVVASAVSPFVVGSTLLVAFGVTGVPSLLVAGAVAGGVAAVVAGFSRGEGTLVVGAALLLLAGVPATLPRALTLLVGATLVLVVDGGTTEVGA